MDLSQLICTLNYHKAIYAKSAYYTKQIISCTFPVRLQSEIFLHNNQQIQTTSFLPHPKLAICTCIDQTILFSLRRLMKSFLKVIWVFGKVTKVVVRRVGYDKIRKRNEK